MHHHSCPSATIASIPLAPSPRFPMSAQLHHALPTFLSAPPLLRFHLRSPHPFHSPIPRASLNPLQGGSHAKATSDDSGRMVLTTSNTAYVAPLESNSKFMTRSLAEILRDLNKKVPDQVLMEGPGQQKYIPWYQANRMLSFYASGWCGEVRDIKFSADGKFVTVIYRVTIRGSDGEAYREASGTVCTSDVKMGDPTQQAEEIAFVRACARFGLGLYLHHDEPQ